MPTGNYSSAWNGFIIPIIIFLLLLLLEYLLMLDQLTITNYKVRASVLGIRVDLPIDSLSAVKAGWFKSIRIGTSSGRIGMLLIKNRDEIYDVLGDLLNKRNSK